MKIISIRLTEEEEKRIEIVLGYYQDRFGKQTPTSVLRLLINEKYKEIEDK